MPHFLLSAHELEMWKTGLGSITERRSAKDRPPLHEYEALSHAARIEWRNFPTSSLRRLLSLDNNCAADRT